MRNSDDPPATPAVTMRDIAQKLGISRPAVSLALRDHPSISEVRRAQVRAVAKELNYRPNVVATALAHRKWSVDRAATGEIIAWINHWPSPEKLRQHREFDSYWCGAAKAAEKFGYHLEEFQVGQGVTLQRLEGILWNRGIKGILIPPLAPDGPRLPWKNFHWEHYSVVKFGHSLTELPVHLITADQVGVARLAYYKMREKGYRRIGFVTSKSSADRLLFKAGYLSAQWEHEQQSGLAPLILDQQQPEQWQALLVKWLREMQPDAIFTEIADTRAMLERADYRVPEDLGLATSSVLDGNANAGVFQNPEEIGRVAVLLIISLIHDCSLGLPPVSRQVLISGSWVDGDTLPLRVTPGAEAAQTKGKRGSRRRVVKSA